MRRSHVMEWLSHVIATLRGEWNWLWELADGYADDARLLLALCTPIFVLRHHHVTCTSLQSKLKSRQPAMLLSQAAANTPYTVPLTSRDISLRRKPQPSPAAPDAMRSFSRPCTPVTTTGPLTPYPATTPSQPSPPTPTSPTSSPPSSHPPPPPRSQTHTADSPRYSP